MRKKTHSGKNDSMKKRFFFSIQLKMLIFFWVLISSSLIIALFTFNYGLPFLPFKGQYEVHQREVIKNLNLVADLKKERLLRWIEERKDDISVLSKFISPDVTKLNTLIQHNIGLGRKGSELWSKVAQDEIYQSLFERLNHFKTTYGVYSKIEILAPSTGEIIFSTRENAELGKNVSQKKLPGNAFTFSDSIISTEKELETDKFVLLFFHLIKTENTVNDKKIENIGILLLHVDTADIINPMLQARGGLGRTGEVLLVNKERKILTQLKYKLADGTTPKVLEHQIKAKPATLAARGSEGIVITEDYRGKQVLAAYRYIRVSPEIGWGMVVKRDKAEVFALLYQSIIYSSFISLIIILITLGLTYLIAKSLSHPILTLAKSTQKVSAGDFSQKVVVKGRDEIAQLSLNFNEMTSRLSLIHKELESFSYSVSHDLRAPLRSMDGFSKFLLRDYNDKLDERGKDFLDRIRNASQRMAKLIDELLKLSRVTRSELTRELVDLSELVNSIADELKKTEPKRRVEFLIQKGLVANGDKPLLRQALVNLIGNAWKYTEKSTIAKIEFGVTQRDGERAYFVRDNGAGFDMAYADKLFGAFQRLHSTEEFEGIGIGLAIFKRIINRHGGDVWGEGKVNEGATFYFNL